MRYIIVYALLLLSAVACGGGAGSDAGSDPDGGQPPASTTYRIELDFERVASGELNPFIVTAVLYKNDALAPGLLDSLTVELGRGTRSAITEVTSGRYQFTVTPDQTGEYPVTVRYESISLTRTALVLKGVHADWGQPMSVSGLVNTEGYEDGITITPDGEYLFVQYGPMYFSAIPLFNMPRASGGCEGQRLEYPAGVANRCTHEWLDNTMGPYTGPERPGFFDGRFSGTTNLHNANSWGVAVEQSPIFAPSTMWYGFRRQADGSFAEPFYVAFEDENDAIINPYGLSFWMHNDGTATILFSLDDPTNPDSVDLDGDGTDDVESFADIYTTTITFGENNNLGTYIYSGTPSTPPVRSSYFPPQLVNFGKVGINGIAGTQGNSHLYQEAGVVKSIWTDDERDYDADYADLSVYVLTAGVFPAGNWEKVILPSAVNKALPSEEIQPFFTGTGLYFTHSDATTGPEIYYAAYSGDDTVNAYGDNSSWGSIQKILELGDVTGIGKVAAIGEPTIANTGESEVLYFVYAVNRGYDAVSGLPDLNMQAGYIRKK